MATVKVNDTLPPGKFSYIPWTKALEGKLACGIPIPLTTDEWKEKKVVIVSVPGAFTPTCHANHLPPYLEKYEEFKKQGVDAIVVIAANDPFVMSGWGRFEGLEDKILTVTDTGAEWSKTLGLQLDLTAAGLGIRTNRFAIIADNLVIKYIGVEPEPGVSVSGADKVLAELKASQSAL